MNKREYNDDEVKEILKRAVEHQDSGDVKYDRDQLFDMGREMGLSQEAIVKAEKEMALGVGPYRHRKRDTSEISPEEAAFRRERMNQIYLILFIFVVGVAFVFLLNLLVGGLSFPWFLIAALGGAVGVLGYYMEEGRMHGENYENAFEKWLNKQKKLEQKRQQRLSERQKE
jgi:hypothetical protein